MSGWRKLLLLIVSGGVIMGGYSLTQGLVREWVGVLPFNLQLPGEEHIPFIPSLLFAYLSVYVLPLILLLFLKKAWRVYKVVQAYLLTFSVQMVCFFIMPMRYDLRPDVPSDGTLISNLYDIMYSIDEPIHTFPSMHVSFAFISYFLFRRFFPKYQWLVLAAASLIAFSTLVVKQHYVVDVVSGILLAMIINALFVQKRRSETMLS